MGNKMARLDRRAVVRALLEDRRDLAVVCGLGAPAWDVFAAGDHPNNFYLWGAMGSAATIGLGLALAQPGRPVAVITGDGELMMGVGALATIGVQRPANLSIVVLDNERYGETGMQLSHTAHGVEPAGIARASGIGEAWEIGDEDGVAHLAGRLHERAGPIFANVKVMAEEVPRVLPPRDGAYLRSRFRESLLGEAP